MYIYYEKIYTIYYGSKLVVYYNKNKHTHKTTYSYYYVCVHASKPFLFRWYILNAVRSCTRVSKMLGLAMVQTSRV